MDHRFNSARVHAPFPSSGKPRATLRGTARPVAAPEAQVGRIAARPPTFPGHRRRAGLDPGEGPNRGVHEPGPRPCWRPESDQEAERAAGRDRQPRAAH